jgi:hypothetical protein
MKLIDAIKKKGMPFKVPNCSRNELPEFFKSLGLKVGAEIGVAQGDFTEKFCNAGLRMYAIDPWAGRGRIYQRVRSRFWGNRNCVLIRKTSMEAINDFQARSLDFVYIDADHRFPFVAEDIYQWYWRVKKGGIVAGHDYINTNPADKDRSLQVQSVVDAFVKTFYIDNLYIFGRSKSLAKETQDDQILSFMFFKNW